jgi:hypothetical protein
MRKLEADATRILHQSNELLREMRKGKENQEEAVQETIAIQDMEEDKVS